MKGTINLKALGFLVVLLFGCTFGMLAAGCNEDNAIDPQLEVNDPFCPPDGSITASFAFFPPYPNPTNGLTSIRFNIPVACHVNILLQNPMGSAVAVVIDYDFPAGTHTVDFDTDVVANGVYTLVMTAEDFRCSGTLVVLRM